MAQTENAVDIFQDLLEMGFFTPADEQQPMLYPSMLVQVPSITTYNTPIAPFTNGEANAGLEGRPRGNRS